MAFIHLRNGLGLGLFATAIYLSVVAPSGALKWGLGATALYWLLTMVLFFLLRPKSANASLREEAFETLGLWTILALVYFGLVLSRQLRPFLIEYWPAFLIAITSIVIFWSFAAADLKKTKSKEKNVPR